MNSTVNKSGSQSNGSVTGRPRDPRAHAAILTATRELLLQSGYSGLTIEGVAQRAGVGKATIYRWWPSKGHLAFEAVMNRTEEVPESSPGELAQVVRSSVEGEIGAYRSQELIRALPGLLADMKVDDRLRRQFREQYLKPQAARIRRGLEDAGDRGALRSGVSPEVVADALAGAVLFRALCSGGPLDERFVDELGALLMNGVAA